MKIQEWSIGIYRGATPWDMRPARDVHNPVLTRHAVTDVAAAFVADPFMLRVEHTWYMFFEVMPRHGERGEIGLATSTNGQQWQYQRIVLREPFHLSYPYVFAWQGAYYMVPESYQAGAIRLYRAERFPTLWQCIATLQCGPYFADTSIFRYADRWWFFTEASPDFSHDTLRLFSAPELTGPWQEHPASPLHQRNPHTARPAGRVVLPDDRLLRFTQDCAPVYGALVRAFEVTRLSTAHYQEQPLVARPILQGSGAGWNADGMHHLDPHPLPDGSWLACVDGFVWSEATPAPPRT
jgi:hypothetical protein